MVPKVKPAIQQDWVCPGVAHPVGDELEFASHHHTVRRRLQKARAAVLVKDV